MLESANRPLLAKLPVFVHAAALLLVEEEEKTEEVPSKSSLSSTVCENTNCAENMHRSERSIVFIRQ